MLIHRSRQWLVKQVVNCSPFARHYREVASLCRMA